MKRAVLLSLTLCVIFAQGSRFEAQSGATISRIEVNQALGVQLNNARKFVAGKNTAIRAYMSEEVTVDSDETSLVIVRDGTTVATLKPRSYQQPTRIISFLCPTRAACSTGAPAGINSVIRYFSLTTDRALGGSVMLAVDYPQPSGNIVDVSTLRLMRWNGARWVGAATECQPASTYDTSVAGRVTVKACALDVTPGDDLFLYNQLYNQVSGTWAAGRDVRIVDLDGNGRDDVFACDRSTRAWLEAINISHPTFNTFTGTWSPGWTLFGGDLNGDRVGDLLLYNPDTGVWFQAFPAGGGQFTYVSASWALHWKVVGQL
ncbi:MAG: VCBS repeat-containing protein [Acidobacteria bacterium]|nr:VCBS repeat-containing protein [Acidobacteriota bacterium]